MPSIYALTEPETGEIRYIGKSVNPKRRLRDHIAKSFCSRLPKDRWIQKILARGLRPGMTVLIETSKDWEADEKALIQKYRKTHRLLNIADGGANSSYECTGASLYRKMMARFRLFAEEGNATFIELMQSHKEQRERALKYISAREYDEWLDVATGGKMKAVLSR